MACKKCDKKKQVKKDEVIMNKIATPFKLTSLKGVKKVKTSSKITLL